MKVAFVTEAKGKGGLAEYSRYIHNQLKNHNPPCTPSFIHEGTQWRREQIIFQLKSTADILHIEYEPGLWGADHRLINLVDDLHLAKKKVALTFHGVSSNERWSHYFRELVRRLDLAIPLTEMQTKALAAHGAVGNVVHIPHGTYIPNEPVPRDSARAQLGIPTDITLCLISGYFDYSKGAINLMEAVTNLRRAGHNLGVLLQGGIHPQLYKTRATRLQFRAYLRDLMLLSHQYNVPLWLNFNYLTDTQLDMHIAASDIICAPYLHFDPEFSGPSGSVHRQIGFGKPLIASRVPRLDDFKDCALIVPPQNTRKLQGGIEYLLDPDNYQEYADSLAEYARETSWQKTADRHITEYEKITKK